MSRVFANGLGDLASISGCVMPKTLRMVLDTTLLNTQQYKVCIKGKGEESRERSSALPYTSVLLLLKREPSSHPRLWSPIFLCLFNIQFRNVRAFTIPDLFYFSYLWIFLFCSFGCGQHVCQLQVAYQLVWVRFSRFFAVFWMSSAILEMGVQIFMGLTRQAAVLFTMLPWADHVQVCNNALPYAHIATLLSPWGIKRCLNIWWVICCCLPPDRTRHKVNDLKIDYSRDLKEREGWARAEARALLVIGPLSAM